MPQDLSSVAGMRAVAVSTLASIERDGARPLTDRQRGAIVHWMVRSMAESRNAALQEQEAGIRAVLEKAAAGKIAVSGRRLDIEDEAEPPSPPRLAR